MARARKAEPTIECPRCGYDVSGTMSTWANECPLEGKCSECGYGFQWKHLLGPNLGVPKWFFETARRRLIRSAISTSVRTVAPWHYWRRVPLHAPVSWRRIGWLTANSLFAVYQSSVLMFLVPFLIEVFDRNAFSPWQAPSGIAMRELFIGPQPLGARLRYFMEVDLVRAQRWPIDIGFGPPFFASTMLAGLCVLASLFVPLGIWVAGRFMMVGHVRPTCLVRITMYSINATAIGLAWWYLGIVATFVLGWLVPQSSAAIDSAAFGFVLMHWWAIWPLWMAVWWFSAFRLHLQLRSGAWIAAVAYCIGVVIACAAVLLLPNGTLIWLRFFDW